jgi:predicted transcriptional regulator
MKNEQSYSEEYSLENRPLEIFQKSRKRDQLQIMLALMEAATEPAKKTHLLFSIRINYYQLIRYLDLLCGLGMLEEIAVPFEGYRITEKGRALLALLAAPVS